MLYNFLTMHVIYSANILKLDNKGNTFVAWIAAQNFKYSGECGS